MASAQSDDLGHVLALLRLAGAKADPLDVEQASRQLDIPTPALHDALELAQRAHLIADPDEAASALTEAGSQFLQAEGNVDPDALFFLAAVIDDLAAREALMHGGTQLVTGFRSALLEGHGARYAELVVPPAFAVAIDERRAVDLFAAGVALIARLSSGEPAGCLAEEILAVAALVKARDWLDERCDAGLMDAADVETAKCELEALFDLFGDADVLSMFEMTDPGDAALAGHSAKDQVMSVVDQRLDAWFEPFGGVPPTGHVGDLFRPVRG
jgi:hypothetical protein